MGKLDIEKLNISERQKEQLTLNLKMSKLEMIYLHKDKDSNIYRTGYNHALQKVVTIKNFACGYWDSNFNKRIENIKDLELLYNFK